MPLIVNKIHKAFILGAGLGTRLRPLTDMLPKPLIPYFHEPLAFHVMRHCQSAGLDSFAVNTHHIPLAWNEAFPKNKFSDSTVEFFHEAELMETGGGIKNIESWIGADPILVYNGDILTDLDLSSLLDTHEKSTNVATLALFSHGPCCNVAVDPDNSSGKITDMRHALQISPGTHQFTGIYIIEPEIISLIPADTKTSIVPAFLELIKQGKLGYHIADGANWQDLGTRDEYLSAHLHPFQDDHQPNIHPDAKIHPSAKIEAHSCFLGANCVIEKGAILSNTIVWPRATVADNTHLDGCIVRQHASGIHKNKDL